MLFTGILASMVLAAASLALSLDPGAQAISGFAAIASGVVFCLTLAGFVAAKGGA